MVFLKLCKIYKLADTLLSNICNIFAKQTIINVIL